MGQLGLRFWASRRPIRQRGSGDLGFTLIELLIVISVLPLVVGGVAIAVMTTLNDEQGLSTKLADSHDAQFTANYYVRDVQSAEKITTGSTIPMCPGTTGTQVLGLEWQPTTDTTTLVSYVLVTTTSTPEVIRNFCSSPTSTPTTSVVSHDTSATTPPNPSQPTLVNSLCPSNANNSLVPSFCWQTVTLVVTEKSGFTYSLTASPRRAPPGGGGTSNLSAPSLLTLGATGTNVDCSGSGKGGLAVNGLAAMDSTSPGSVVLGKNETLGASSIGSPEGSSAVTSGSGNGTYTPATAQPYSTGPPVPDPYIDLPDAPTNVSVQSSMSSLPGPGLYPNPVTITSSQMNIPTGIYIFEKGLTISGNSTSVTSGSGGVLFFIGIPIPLASPGTAQTAAFGVSGSGTLSLNAMTTGSYAGVVMFQSRTDSNPMVISGNGSTTVLTYGGVVYAPDAQVQTDGNGTTQVGGVVSKSFQCGGNGAVTIGPAATTPNVTIATSQNPIVSGQPVTFTATLGDPVNGYTPAGSVTFTANGSAIPACSSVSLNTLGQAQCTTSSLTAAGSPYTVSAMYTPPTGTATYTSASASLPNPGQVVNPASTGTTLISSFNPSGVNQNVTYTATVRATAPGSGTPTGFVEFLDGGTAIAACGGASGQALSSGNATCTISYSAAGSHTITAQYLGSTSFSGSTSSNLTQMVVSGIVPQISNFAEAQSGGSHQAYSGTTNVANGTVTVNVCKGTVTSCTSSTTGFVTSYTITVSSTSWSKTTTGPDPLTNGQTYTATASQVAGGISSSNDPSITFTGN